MRAKVDQTSSSEGEGGGCRGAKVDERVPDFCF